MKNQSTFPELILTVANEDLPFYTTLFQSGIEIKSNNDETMAHFLNNLPGFTIDYVANTVQTIFLNGSAVDDLSTPLGSKNPVLALSAAMPGLAGAIFRRNSYHAALRTATDGAVVNKKENEPTLVTLKLFNSIARERGGELLQMGVTINTRHFVEFMTKRETLIQKVARISLADNVIDKRNLASLLADTKKINLKINTNHG